MGFSDQNWRQKFQPTNFHKLQIFHDLKSTYQGLSNAVSTMFVRLLVWILWFDEVTRHFWKKQQKWWFFTKINAYSKIYSFLTKSRLETFDTSFESSWSKFFEFWKIVSFVEISGLKFLPFVTTLSQCWFFGQNLNSKISTH